MMMKSAKNTLQVLTASCVLLICCAFAAAQDVRYNFLPGTDFSKYKTYKWVRVPKAQYPNELLDGQLIRSIDAQLAAKGLTKTEGESADLYVAYQVAVDQKQQWNSYSTDMGGWGWGGWRGWGGGMGTSTTTTTQETINIGTLDLDMYDAAQKKQVWRGEVSKTIKPQKNPEKLQKNIDKAMTKLLKNYPPPAKK